MLLRENARAPQPGTSIRKAPPDMKIPAEQLPRRLNEAEQVVKSGGVVEVTDPKGAVIYTITPPWVPKTLEEIRDIADEYEVARRLRRGGSK